MIKAYYFIYFLDSDFKPSFKDNFIQLYPAGFLLVGEGEWPEIGDHSKSNVYFSLDEAKAALKKMEKVLNSFGECIPNYLTTRDSSCPHKQ